MTLSDEKDVMESRGLKKDLIIFLLVYISFGLVVGPLMLAFEISRAPEELGLPSVGSVVSPALQAFAIGLLASLVIGKWVTSRLAAYYKNQHLSQGVVLDNQNSLFANFGFNLGMGAFIGVSFFEGVICHIPLTEDVSGSLTAILACKTVINSAIALFVGITVGLGIWLVYQVVLIEKETNQKMMVQYYSSRQWSLIGIVGVAAAVYVIGLMFYKIFTLDQP